MDSNSAIWHINKIKAIRQQLVRATGLMRWLNIKWQLLKQASKF